MSTPTLLVLAAALALPLGSRAGDWEDYARAQTAASAAAPDLSARPDRDSLLRALRAEPDLHARAIAGRSSMSAGTALIFVGVIFAVGGGLVWLAEDFGAGMDDDPATSGAGPFGPVVATFGLATFVAGWVVRGRGSDRLASAVDDWNARHPDAPLTR